MEQSLIQPGDDARSMEQRLEAGWRQMSLPELARALARLRADKEVMEANLAVTNKAYDMLRMAIIPDKLDEAGVTSMTVEGVGRLGLTADVYASIVGENKAAAYEWLSDHGHGDLIQPTVNSSSLKALMRRAIASGEEVPEDLFKVTPYRRASITKV